MKIIKCEKIEQEAISILHEDSPYPSEYRRDSDGCWHDEYDTCIMMSAEIQKQLEKLYQEYKNESNN